MKQVEELDTVLNYKRIAQNIKTTEASLEKAERNGFAIKAGTFRVIVPETKYSVVYKVKINPTKKLIVKKILRCR